MAKLHALRSYLAKRREMNFDTPHNNSKRHVLAESRTFPTLWFMRNKTLLLRNGTPFCGAFRLRSNVFVSARHCFFGKDTHPDPSITGDQEDIKLSVIAESAQQVSIRSKITPSSTASMFSKSYSDADDYIFLKTDPISIEAPQTKLILATVSDPLLLLGYYRFHQPEWVFGDPKSRGTREHWSRGMRWTQAPLCRVGPTLDSCISHFCQSDRGFSGSALLALSSDSPIAYYGIHIGTMSTRSTCKVDTESTAGNMGIRIDPTQIADATF